jgi:hypothetical protein
MTDQQLKLYTKTKARFRLVGIENPAEVIVALTEEVEALKNGQRPRAEWECENGMITCSHCHHPAPIKSVSTGLGASVLRSVRTDYCPNCGAEMMRT